MQGHDGVDLIVNEKFKCMSENINGYPGHHR